MNEENFNNPSAKIEPFCKKNFGLLIHGGSIALDREKGNRNL